MEDNNLICDLQLNDPCVLVKEIKINGLLILIGLVSMVQNRCHKIILVYRFIFVNKSKLY